MSTTNSQPLPAPGPDAAAAHRQAAALAWCRERLDGLLRIPAVTARAVVDPEATRDALCAAVAAELLAAGPSTTHPEHADAAGAAGAIPSAVWLQEHARGSVAGPPPSLPAAAIHTVHQELLGTGLQRTGHGVAWASASGPRKRLGSYCTPTGLARPIALRTLRPFRRRREPPLILDAAAGCGALLLAAVEVLAPAPQSDRRREIALASLFGIELDPVAAVLLRWAVVEFCGLRPGDWPRIASQLLCGDALTGPPLDLAEGNSDPAERPADAIPWRAAFPAAAERGGFDAILGNPPWETLQVNAVELADVHGGRHHRPDPATGSAAQVDRLRYRATADPVLRARWHQRREFESARRAQLRRHARQLGYRHQGRGKLHTDRLFLERCWWALRPGGRLGMLLPAGLQSDRDAAGLRRMLWETGRWQWWFQGENRARWFPIDSRFRFGIAVAVKTPPSSTRPEPAVRYARTVTDGREWQRPRPRSVRYPRRLVAALSPAHEALLDVADGRELELLQRLHADHAPLVGPGAPLAFRQGDFNMTRDAPRFIPRDRAEAEGYRQGPDQVWRCRGRPDLLPLYQGAMIQELHPNAGWFRAERGARSRWQPAPRGTLRLRPRYLVAGEDFRARLERLGRDAGPRLVLRALSNATNQRTVVAALLWGQPCGNSLAVLEPPTQLPEDERREQCAWGAAVLGSLVFDWAWRRRMPGNNLNGYLLGEVGWPEPPTALRRRAAELAAQLGWILPAHGSAWHHHRPDPRALDQAHRARRLASLDALVARAAGLCAADLAAMLLPGPPHHQDPRGFWRLDRERPPGHRRPNRAVRALRALE